MTPSEAIKLLEKDLSIALIATNYEKRYLISNVNGIKIEIFPNEHPPAHFHIRSPDIQASFTVESCELFEGNVDSATLRKIKEFHARNIVLLIETWNKLRPSNCPVGPINM